MPDGECGVTMSDGSTCERPASECSYHDANDRASVPALDEPERWFDSVVSMDENLVFVDTVDDPEALTPEMARGLGRALLDAADVVDDSTGDS